jgi:hypothetical protein
MPLDQRLIFSSRGQHSIFTARKKHKTTTLSPINSQMIFGSHEKYDFTPAL